MNSYDKYAEMTDDQQWQYVEHEYEINERMSRSQLADIEEMEEDVEDVEDVSEAQKRKDTPVFSGVLKYFPNALKEISKCSKAGNDQHHPDKPLHWDMDKSKDEYDALTRHLIDHTIDPMDTDGILHLTKVSWRALAGLERYLTNKH